MAFIDEYVGMLLETAEVPGDSNIETVSKRLFSELVVSLSIAQKLQSLADAGDTEILEVSRSLISLAQEFNKAFKNLTAEQKARISAVVKGIVVGANQGDIEAFFDATLNVVGTVQEYVAELTVLLETEPPVEE
jgi:signal transduction histidine kinase